MSRCPSTPSLPRVIQMIDENKEQLRNLFRNYNVLDVQPAITTRAPDDLSALQVTAHLGLEMALHGLEGCFTQIILGGCPPLGAGSMPEVATTSLSLPDGNHCAGRPALPGCHALHPHELVLPDSVSNTRALPRQPQCSHGPGGSMRLLLALAVPTSKGGQQHPNTYFSGAQPGFRNCSSFPKCNDFYSDITSPHQAHHPWGYRSCLQGYCKSVSPSSFRHLP